MYTCWQAPPTNIRVYKNLIHNLAMIWLQWILNSIWLLNTVFLLAWVIINCPGESCWLLGSWERQTPLCKRKKLSIGDFMNASSASSSGRQSKPVLEHRWLWILSMRFMWPQHTKPHSFSSVLGLGFVSFFFFPNDHCKRTNVHIKKIFKLW